jgi:hypothetical protein
MFVIAPLEGQDCSGNLPRGIPRESCGNRDVTLILLTISAKTKGANLESKDDFISEDNGTRSRSAAV